ncbi:MAG: DUF1565 domain-containing protein [Candidatus Coatesbacteria bacterium]|nr:DUF1565 domain-containing protein [Candidatus Coatesbacteria bacterium]
MKTLIYYSITILMIALSFGLSNAIAAPQISIYTDSSLYQAGDTIEVSLEAPYPGPEAVYVDVYIGLLNPDGVLYTLSQDGWTEGINTPWIENYYLRYGRHLDSCFRFLLPCDIPPINEPGEFFFLAALTRAGTTDLLGCIDSAGFLAGMPQATDYYVDAECGNDKNYGMEDAPWRSITRALCSIDSLEGIPTTIHIAPGTYTWCGDGETFPLEMKSWVSLIADEPGAIIDADDSDANVILAEDVHNAAIDGFTITGAILSGHLKSHAGGGICCLDSSILITNNTIIENTGSGYGGGGIYCGGGSPEIMNNVISWNKVDCIDESDRGGGIYCRNSAARIVNNTIANNEAQWGGGIYIYAYSYEIAVREISNNTIVNNIASIGAGIYLSGISTEITDCVIWEDSVGSKTMLDYVSASFCCVKGGYLGEGNIDLDPQFGGELISGFRYYLRPGSPCIDAGSRSAEEAGLSGMTAQMDGTPDTGTVDMGAHYPIP